MRTARLKSLFEEVLKSMPKPYGDDLVEDVFLAIEHSPRWKKEYDQLQYDLGKNMLNPWGGFWIAHLTGLVAREQVSASRTALLESYAKLVKAPKADRKAKTKVKDPEALKLMSEYFYANRESLSTEVRDRRSLILELIKCGYAVEDAFARSIEKPALAR